MKNETEKVLKKKNNRYRVPDEEECRGIKLYSNPRYERILLHLWKYRYCTIEHIASLLELDRKTGILKPKGKRPEPKAYFPITRIQQNLNTLWQNGYIHRRFVTPKASLKAGTEKDIWHLSQKGAEFIAEHTGLFVDHIDFPKLPNPSKSHEGSPVGEYDFLKHHIAITQVLVTFQVFCHLSGKYRIIFFEPDKRREYKFTAIIDEKEASFFIRPDGIIILERISDQRRSTLFLEIDRATERLGYWQQKLKGYFYLKDSEQHLPLLKQIYTEKELIQSTEQLPPEWLKAIKVLCPTLGNLRINNMMKATYPLFNKGKGSPLFWYTSLEHFTLSKREAIETKSGSIYHKMALELEKALILEQQIWYSGHKDHPDNQVIF